MAAEQREESTITTTRPLPLQIYKELPFLQDVGTQTVAAEMRAGDCSFHSGPGFLSITNAPIAHSHKLHPPHTAHTGMLVHGAGANMTMRPRRAMTVQMMPVGSRFNGKRNILTKEEFDALKVRHRESRGPRRGRH